MDRIIVVSGYFNPLHTGHLDYLESARELGDSLFVIVNNDHQVELKGSTPFMSLEERVRIVEALSCVHKAYPSIDTDSSVVKTLKEIWNEHSSDYFFDSMTFANGGDRKPSNVPEYEICERLGIHMAFNVGGGKTQSSSDLLNNINHN